MLEIATDLNNRLILRESDESKGIGQIWEFGVLQDYIYETSLDKNIVPHLVRLCLKEVNDISAIALSHIEFERLEKELSRALYKIYYPSEIRPFKVELADGYFRFYEGEDFFKHATVLRYERDLMAEGVIDDGKRKKTKKKPNKNQKEEQQKTIEDVTVSFISYLFEGKNLTVDEIKLLVRQVIELYELWKTEEAERLKELETFQQKKKGFLGFLKK